MSENYFQQQFNDFGNEKETNFSLTSTAVSRGDEKKREKSFEVFNAA